MVDKKVKARKVLKEQDKAYENQKQSAAEAKEQELNKKIMQDIKPVSQKKGL